MRAILASCALTAISVSLAFPVEAEGVSPSSAPQSGTDIIVTAQKREQKRQDVPLVVASVSGKALEKAGITDIKQLTLLVPGLMLVSTSSTNSTTARIRGIGTEGFNTGLESSVGVVIDGIYRPKPGVGFGDLGELDRIEVLKGPQGTLFGKNTSAGVINVVTRAPTFKTEIDGELTGSNYNGYGIAASVNSGIIDDKLAGRIYVVHRQRDGYVNVLSGHGPRGTNDDNDQNETLVRGQLLFTPTPDLAIKLIGDYSRRNEECCGAALYIAGTGATSVNKTSTDAIGVPADFKNYTSYENQADRKIIIDKGLSVEANWNLSILGGATLTSLTGARDWSAKGGIDIDYTTLDLLNSSPSVSRAKFVTQEFRLAGHRRWLDWQVGIFGNREETSSVNATVLGSDFERYESLLLSGGTNPNYLSHLAGVAPGTVWTANQGQLDSFNQVEKSFAIFTNNDVHLTDRLILTLGARYTWEHKVALSHYRNQDGGRGCALLSGNPAIAAAQVATFCQTFSNPNFNDLNTRQSLSNDALSGTAKLSYKVTRDIMTYASYARGFKAGGFNLDRLALPFSRSSPATSLKPVTDTAFDPEYMDAWELGLRTSWFDHKLTFNITGFYEKVTDFQLSAFNGLVFTTTSIPRLTSKGFDADFSLLPFRGVTLQGGVTFADARYTKKDAAILGPLCTAVGVPTGCSYLPGNRLNLAPLWSTSLSVNYEHPLTSGLTGQVNIAAKYVSSYNAGSDLAPNKEINGFAIINVRLGVGPRDGRWTAELWAENLFDKRYPQTLFNGSFQAGNVYGYPSAPRIFGGTLRVKYR